MIFSKQQLFSDDQAITASAASTNLLDLGVEGTVLLAPNDLVRDIGKGTPIPIWIGVTVAFATLTSLKVAIQTDDDVAFGSAKTVLETEAIALANLVAGYRFNLDYIPLDTAERYVRLNYTVAGSDATAGQITAGIVAGAQEGPLAGVAGLGGT